MRLAILLPTRNRHALTMQGIESVLAQPVPGSVELVVSDNSSPGCTLRPIVPRRRAGQATFVVIRPPEELAMAAHWEWATNQILADGEATHLMVLTDRCVLVPGIIDRLASKIGSDPDRVIVFPLPHMADFRRPPFYASESHTGRMYSVNSTDLLRFVASGHCRTWVTPRPMNAVIPVEILHRLTHRYGHMFGGIAPDYHLAYHLLAEEDTLLAFDDVVAIQHSLKDSNGMAMVWGRTNDASRDFAAQLGEAPLNVPIKAVRTVSNFIFHEYNEVRAESGNVLPAVELAGYKTRLRLDISDLRENPALAAQYGHHLGEDEVAMSRWRYPRRRLLPYEISRLLGLNRAVPHGYLRIRNLEHALEFAGGTRRYVAPTAENWPPGAESLAD